MTPGAHPQKTAELQLLETVAADVRDIKLRCERFDREGLILRTRMRTAEKTIAKTEKTVTDHERKINYALGGSAVIGVVIGFLLKKAEKIGAIFN